MLRTILNVFIFLRIQIATDQTRTKTMALWLDKFQAALEEEIVKINTMNTFGQILKCDHYLLASETGNLLHVKLDLNVLCLLLSTFLPDSDPVFI